MDYKYIWNSETNSFDGYEPKYETKVDDEGNETQVEIPCEHTIYTQDEVEAILKNRGKHQIIKDVNGVPTAIDFYAESELAAKVKIERINKLKALLKATDYKAIKYAEGLISEADYLPIKLERQGYRNQINELEAQA